jgi:hypothetical protein
MNKHNVEYTDTFAGDANYSWVQRHIVTMPELTHFGYTGSVDGSYSRANRVYNRELMKKAKALVGLTGVRGRTYWYGDNGEFRPYRSATVLFITYRDDCEEESGE